MEIKPIKSAVDHEAALAEIERLWDAPHGSPEADRLDVLSTLVDAYEAQRWPIDPPDPIETIKFRMEQQGLQPKDLVSIIGHRSHVYEVLNGKRALSMAMVFRLHKQLGIPAESLLMPVKRRARPKTRHVTRRRKRVA